jgi:hypothetical protein
MSALIATGQPAPGWPVMELSVGARLFAGMSTDDIKVLRADLLAGLAKQHRAYGYDTPERAAYEETSDLVDDLHEAWKAAFERETGAERVAAIRRAVHVDHVIAAAQLLAAERAA